VNPGDANAVAALETARFTAGTLDATNDLMTGDDRILRRDEASFDEIEVGSTNTAD
jgi:hypothetical protein